MTPPQFLTQIKKGPAAVYLFVGPEMYRRRICRRKLFEAHLGDDAPEEAFTRFDLDETGLRDIVEDACAMSLFASRRLIVASGAEAAVPRGQAKDDTNPGHAALAAYVANPAPGVVLVLDSHRYGFDGDDKSRMERLRKFYAAVPNVVEFTPYTIDEARRVAADLASQHAVRIGPAELDSLVEALGGDVARIDVELEKLSLFTGGARPVTGEDIQRLVPDARSTTVFALVNALSRGDRGRSLDLLETFLREGEYLPLALSFVATQFRYALAAKDAGLRTAQQIQGHFQKLGVAMWPSRAQQVLSTMSAFTQPQLESAVARLYATDKGFRDRSPDDRILMEDLVLGLTR